MASLPARQPSQRRSSPPEHEHPQHTPTYQSHNASRADQPQPIFDHSARSEQTQPQDTSEEPISSKAVPVHDLVDESESVKRCWICFEDSTDDTPDTSPWRHPCPCALEAHEECLLDWIADVEGLKNTNNRSIAGPKIQCPQCKSEIKLSRPHDYVVNLVRACERLALRAVTPGALFMLSGMLYHSSVVHGIHSIFAVFGAEDGLRILAPLHQNISPVEINISRSGLTSPDIQSLILHRVMNWRLYLGIPLIPTILIFSRTSLADGILPVLPIVFFASQAHSPDDALDFASWPPSASFSFAVLPYLRTLYNFYYQKVWAEREKQWLRELQPRATQNQDGDAGANDDQRDEPQDGNVFEVRIDGGLWENWGDEQRPEAAVDDAAGQQVGEDEAAPGPDVQDNRPLPRGGGNEPRGPNAAQEQPQAPNQEQNANQQNRQQLDRQIAFSPLAVAETVLGSILFPTLAGLTGEALKLVLPRSWTMPAPAPSAGYSRLAAKGFFQHKWARSIVGGCLIVVCKDALILYTRWRMVQMHRGRRVVDFDKKRSRQEKRANS